MCRGLSRGREDDSGIEIQSLWGGMRDETPVHCATDSVGSDMGCAWLLAEMIIVRLLAVSGGKGDATCRACGDGSVNSHSGAVEFTSRKIEIVDDEVQPRDFAVSAVGDEHGFS